MRSFKRQCGPRLAVIEAGLNNGNGEVSFDSFLRECLRDGWERCKPGQRAVAGYDSTRPGFVEELEL